MVETSEEVIYLLLSFCEITEAKAQGSNFLVGTFGKEFPKIQSCLQEAVSDWIREIKEIVCVDPSSTHIHETKLALLWGIIRCYPQLIDVQKKSSCLMDLIDALNQLLMMEAGMERSVLFRLISCSICTLKHCVCSPYFQVRIVQVLGKSQNSFSSDTS